MSFTLPIYNTLSWQEKVVLVFTSMVFVAQPIPFVTAKLAVFILAVGGLWILFFQRKIARNPGFKQLFLVMLLLSLPGLISLFGTYNLDKTMDFLLLSPVFFAAGVTMYSLFLNRLAVNILVTVIAIVSCLWILDALYQYFIGVDVFGNPQEDRGNWGTRVTGPFPNNNHLGMLLTVTLPVTLKWLTKFHAICQLLYLSCLCFVLLVAGTKTDWVTFMVAFICFYWFIRGGRVFFLCVLTPLLIGSIWVASIYSPIAAKKMDQMISVPTSLKEWDDKSTGRIHIWATALNMGIQNSATGVGAKSFKYAYLDHKPEWDPSGQKNGITTHSHAHHPWFSIFAETGIFGVVSLVAIVLLIILITKKSVYGFNFYHYPWLLTFLLILNPINSMPPLFKMWWFPIFLLAVISQISAVENAEREIDNGIA